MTWFTFRAFIRNRITAKRLDAFHSPYLFHLFSYSGDDRISFGEFRLAESIRQRWLKNEQVISRHDPGAGSFKPGKSEQQRVSDIARYALSRPYQCRFMARLVRHEKAARILELGTSLGIATCYLQAGNHNALVTTVEGDPAIATLAQETFAASAAVNTQLVSATFDAYFKTTPQDAEPFDVIFLDGHHRAEALWRYYEQLENRISTHTIVIVDDIYWSRDMWEGWKKLISRPEVTQSVDCFQFGLIFFRKDFLDKAHHRVRLPLKAFFR
jgi:predicted O-methyltransferase YrrM